MVRHLLVALALVGVAVAGGVHYDALYDEKWPYPTDEGLSADYDEYVGEQVLLFGDVESIDRTADRATIEVEADNGPFTVTVEGIDADVEPGGVVQVYGTVRPGQTIAASNVVVVEASSENRLYQFAVSGVGAVLVLAAFFRYWRIDWAALTFEPR